MKYYSTRNPSIRVSARDAISSGLADDGGLYMPERIPALSREFLETFTERPFDEIAEEVLAPYFENEIPRQVLGEIVRDAFPFPIPLRPISDRTFVLELFHGPTLAFKDFGARFLSRVLSYFRREETKELWILVATSGDTGSAVANGFYDVPGIRVVVLYPKGKVSPLQEAQMTTLGKNICALEIDGTFDDCQRMVKSAFVDSELKAARTLSSANSINLGRLLPQMLYYFSALAQLPQPAGDVVCSVPSGNLGNISAGLFAQRMGLPVRHFVAATNRNDALPEFLRSDVYRARPSVSTISNAMDVGDPNNIVRLFDFLGSTAAEMQKALSGYAFDDERTLETMSRVYAESGYILDPHGAVGLLGLEAYRAEQENPAEKFSIGIVLETAHPAKFTETVKKAIGREIEIPQSLQSCIGKEKFARPMAADYSSFKEFLLSTSN
jgi:threonine synthase